MDYRYRVAIIAVAALFMDLLDLTVVNVALPAIQDEFDIPEGPSSMAVTAYLAALAVVMPASGWAVERFGAPRTFLFATAVFTLGSAAAAGAWTFESLVAARTLQGVGGGLLAPVGMAMLFRAFSEADRATASALFSVPAAIAPALGPLVGGFFVDAASWRYVFLVNIPVGAFAFVAGQRWLHPEPANRVHRLDVKGFGLAATTVVGLILGLTWFAEHGFGLRSGVAVVLGLTGLACLVIEERKRVDPLIPVRLFKRRSFAVGQATMLVSAAGFGGLLFALPLLLQNERGLSATATGSILGCHAVGILICTPAGPRLVNRLGEARVLAFGIIGTALTTGVAAWLALGGSPLAFATLMLLAGMAFGLLIVPQQTLPFRDLDAAELPQGTSILATVRQVGVAVGTALATIPIGWHPDKVGFSIALAIAALVTLTGVLAVGAMRSATASTLRTWFTQRTTR